MDGKPEEDQNVFACDGLDCERQALYCLLLRPPSHPKQVIQAAGITHIFLLGEFFTQESCCNPEKVKTNWRKKYST